MDFFSSVAKRTRSREAVYLRTEWEKRKKRRNSNKGGGSASREGECGAREESNVNGVDEVGDSVDIGLEKVRSGEDNGFCRGSGSVLLVEETEGEEVGAEAREEVGKRFEDIAGKRYCDARRGSVEEDGRFNSVCLEKKCLEEVDNLIGIICDEKESSVEETEQNGSKFNSFCLEKKCLEELRNVNEVVIDESSAETTEQNSSKFNGETRCEKESSAEETGQNSSKFNEEARYGKEPSAEETDQNGFKFNGEVRNEKASSAEETVQNKFNEEMRYKKTSSAEETEQNKFNEEVRYEKTSSAEETEQNNSKLNEEERLCEEERSVDDDYDNDDNGGGDGSGSDYESDLSANNDDENDEDYQTDSLHDSDTVEESTSDEEDGDSEDIDASNFDCLQEPAAPCKINGDGKVTKKAEDLHKGRLKQKIADNSEGTLRRRRYSGLSILVAPNDVNGSCVAQRTRSHGNSGSSKKKKKKKKEKYRHLGFIDQPICLSDESDSSTEEESTSSAAEDGNESCDDEDEDEEVDEDCDDSDDEDYGKHISVVKNQVVKENVNSVRRTKSELEKPSARKRVRAPKGGSLFNLFVNTIWEKGGVLEPELSHSEDDTSEKEIIPPGIPNFLFEVEDPIPEKTDYEKELDLLWTEFDFALRSTELGSFGTSMVEPEDTNELDVERDATILCRQGKHQLIVDEQIGIRCRLCSFVKLESKYLLPLIDTYRSERIGRRNYLNNENLSLWDEFQFHDDPASLGSFLETKGTIWDKFPDIKQKMYPHQQDGFEFMWKNLAGSIDLDKLQKPADLEGVGGCVISHAPGTGKTLLTIIFLQTYMEVFRDCRPVIMAPCSMLLTWEAEFRKWKVDIPFHNLNAPDFSGNEDRYALRLIGARPQKNRKWNRIVKLLSWSKGRSILGISYSLFEKLAGERFVRGKEGEKKEIPRDQEAEDIRKILLEKPSLLVLDEGHTPRNERSRIWKALQNIKTERRIILSGTPFQNNFDELYNTLWLVRPKFADRISNETQKVFRKKLKLHKKEARGKWVSLTSSIGKHADSRLLEVIRSMIDPFVHVHRGSILQQNLPGLRDCMILLHPPLLQVQVLEEVKDIPNPLELEHVVSLVSVHPSLLLTCNHSGIQKSLIEKISPKSYRLDPNNGVKTRFLMELIKLVDTVNEKVLVFSQFIDPFFLIKDQLQAHFNWNEGREVLQMDGKLDVKRRQLLINHFNDPSSKVRVLLASTKACREGISLVGASRIVLLDVVWNPSVERQAISRAYRIGQKKIVHTYHLITSGTMEAEKYCRQVEKDRLSNLVFSSSNGNLVEHNCSSSIPDDKILDAMLGNSNLKDMFEKIISQRKTFD